MLQSYQCFRVHHASTLRSAVTGESSAVIGYRSSPLATPDEVLAAVRDKITEIMRAALSHPEGPLAGGCERAAAFLRSWWGEPPDPPFAK